MNIETIIMPLAFIFLCVVLLWFVILSRGFWWLKMMVIALTLFLGNAMWDASNTYLGWPTASDMPDLYLIHWGVVDEPDKTDVLSKGAIYLWVQDISDKDLNNEESLLELNFLEYNANDNIIPRSYKMPYTKQKHAQMQQMMDGIKKGKRYIGGKKAKGKGEGEGEGDGKGKKGDGKGKGKKGWNYLNPSKEFNFYELPPPKLPRKV